MRHAQLFFPLLLVGKINCALFNNNPMMAKDCHFDITEGIVKFRNAKTLLPRSHFRKSAV